MSQVRNCLATRGCQPLLGHKPIILWSFSSSHKILADIFGLNLKAFSTGYLHTKYNIQYSLNANIVPVLYYKQNEDGLQANQVYRLREETKTTGSTGKLTGKNSMKHIYECIHKEKEHTAMEYATNAMEF